MQGIATYVIDKPIANPSRIPSKYSTCCSLTKGKNIATQYTTMGSTT